eukprot:scaffold7491_cov49-Phaeocystis_antarctica.AAC.1
MASGWPLGGLGWPPGGLGWPRVASGGPAQVLPHIAARQGPLGCRPGASGHTGLHSAITRHSALDRMRSVRSGHPQRRAAAGSGAGRGRAAGPDLPRTRHARRRRRCLGTRCGFGPRCHAAKKLALPNCGLSDTGLIALVPGLWARPELVSIAARVAPPPPAPAGARTPPIGVLWSLTTLNLDSTEITDVGCAAFAAALDRDRLSALETLRIIGIPASLQYKRDLAACLESDCYTSEVRRRQHRGGKTRY